MTKAIKKAIKITTQVFFKASNQEDNFALFTKELKESAPELATADKFAGKQILSKNTLVAYRQKIVGSVSFNNIFPHVRAVWLQTLTLIFLSKLQSDFHKIGSLLLGQADTQVVL